MTIWHCAISEQLDANFSQITKFHMFVLYAIKLLLDFKLPLFTGNNYFRSHYAQGVNKV